MNANAQEIKDLILSIHQSLTEIENAHHNDRVEVCVVLQFLKETIIDYISQNVNWLYSLIFKLINQSK